MDSHRLARFRRRLVRAQQRNVGRNVLIDMQRNLNTVAGLIYQYQPLMAYCYTMLPGSRNTAFWARLNRRLLMAQRRNTVSRRRRGEDPGHVHPYIEPSLNIRQSPPTINTFNPIEHDSIQTSTSNNRPAVRQIISHSIVHIDGSVTTTTTAP